MISEGRIPMGDDEARELGELFAQHDPAGASITRRDPGDTGPIVVTFADGTTHTIPSSAADNG